MDNLVWDDTLGKWDHALDENGERKSSNFETTIELHGNKVFMSTYHKDEPDGIRVDGYLRYDVNGGSGNKKGGTLGKAGKNTPPFELSDAGVKVRQLYAGLTIPRLTASW